MTPEAEGIGPSGSVVAGDGPSSVADLVRAWFVISTTSLGGGPSTLQLMRQVLIREHRWLSEREYLESWALSKLSPGIGLIAMAGLIGMRVRGAWGATLSMLTLVVPAALLTLLMTIGYSSYRDSPLLEDAFAGVGPVSAGMIVGLGYSFVRQATRPGRPGLADIALAGMSIVASLLGAPAVAIIGVGLLLGLALLRGPSIRSSNE